MPVVVSEMFGESWFEPRVVFFRAGEDRSLHAVSRGDDEGAHVPAIRHPTHVSHHPVRIAYQSRSRCVGVRMLYMDPWVSGFVCGPAESVAHITLYRTSHSICNISRPHLYLR